MVRGISALLMVESDKTVEERTNKRFLVSQKADSNRSSMHDPVNLGNPREVTVLEIAKLVLKLTGFSSPITHHPLPADDPKVRRPDIQRAQVLLGWEPKVPLEEAILRTIEYFLKVLAH
jgi:dTDP-glucose 4,6-dehydratase